MGFPRQEYWSRLPFPPPEDLPDLGTESMIPALEGGFFTTGAPGKAVSASSERKRHNLNLSSLPQEFTFSLIILKYLGLETRKGNNKKYPQVSLVHPA